MALFGNEIVNKSKIVMGHFVGSRVLNGEKVNELKFNVICTNQFNRINNQNEFLSTRLTVVRVTRTQRVPNTRTARIKI